MRLQVQVQTDRCRQVQPGAASRCSRCRQLSVHEHSLLPSINHHPSSTDGRWGTPFLSPLTGHSWGIAPTAPAERWPMTCQLLPVVVSFCQLSLTVARCSDRHHPSQLPVALIDHPRHRPPQVQSNHIQPNPSHDLPFSAAMQLLHFHISAITSRDYSPSLHSSSSAHTALAQFSSEMPSNLLIPRPRLPQISPSPRSSTSCPPSFGLPGP